METAGIPARLPCEICGNLHIDTGIWATKPHHTHACQFCGHVWRPMVINSVGVRFLPGFKNDDAPPVTITWLRGAVDFATGQHIPDAPRAPVAACYCDLDPTECAARGHKVTP